ncbi:hypothetical protein ACFXA3_07055 [Streptomyces sp. NPDC059456]|uniref:hypothetical protein n=1 Tax=Streptomyces sp. NPDC059456 TaxID=3346838 RepID=UPI00368B658A
MVVENWQQAAVVVVVVVVLGLFLWSMRHRITKLRLRPWSGVVEAAPDTDPGDQVLQAKRSKVLKSWISTFKEGKIRLVDSKVKKSTIVVRKDDDPDPDPGTTPGRGPGPGPGGPQGGAGRS